jgi:hypothetical protein
MALLGILKYTRVVTAQRWRVRNAKQMRFQLLNPKYNEEQQKYGFIMYGGYSFNNGYVP